LCTCVFSATNRFLFFPGSLWWAYKYLRYKLTFSNPELLPPHIPDRRHSRLWKGI
jgi:hypothetical protein